MTFTGHGGWVCSDEQVYPEVGPLQYTAFGVPGVEILAGVIRCNYEACELFVFAHSLFSNLVQDFLSSAALQTA